MSILVTYPWISCVDCETSVSTKHDVTYGVPTLAELGKEEKDCGPCLFPGGETEALNRMEKMLKKVVNIIPISVLIVSRRKSRGTNNQQWVSLSVLLFPTDW